MHVQYAYGANYLVYNQYDSFTCKRINLTRGRITLKVGDKVERIGKKERTSFSMKPGFYMQYEGLLNVNGIDYAIFNCPAHNASIQTGLFETKQYRYAFAVVFVKGAFACFLVGSRGHRDIIMDDLKIIQ